MSTLFALHLLIIAGISPEISTEMWLAARHYGVEPYDLAAVLISEHSSYDADFSIMTSIARGHPYKWPVDREGQAGELGLFQVQARWARKAGFEADDRADPIASAWIAAYVIHTAQDSHSKCSDPNHDWIAHWKGGDRDALTGQSRFAQSKWSIIRQSIRRLTPVNVRRLHHQNYEKARQAQEGV